MRLISWNCQGGFHRKHHLVGALSPDVLIVPECARMDGLPAELGSRGTSSFHWCGNKPGKGLAVMSFGEYVLEPLIVAEVPKWVVPMQVTGPETFILFAVWTLPSIELRSYCLPLFEAHRIYQERWPGCEIVWAGDFNASVLFDKPSRRYKFRDLIGELEVDGIRSLYHEQTGCGHGEENHKSYFHYRHESRAHHIDYVFASEGIRKAGYSITAGSFADWSRHSDHVPMICDLGINAATSAS